MIKQVIFDLDGLMIDSERHMWVVNETKIGKELGYDFDLDFLRSFMGQGREHTIETITKKYGKNFPFEEFYEKLDKCNIETVEKGLVPYKEGLIELLDYLKTTNIKLTVGTSSHKHYVEKVLERNNLYDRFDVVVCGDEVKHTKPDPDIYLKCMSYFNFDPSEVIIFEDADLGGRAALASKARLIIVKDMAPVSEYVCANSYKVLDSLLDAIDIIKEEYEATTSV